MSTIDSFDLALLIVCPFCGVQPDETCRTRYGLLSAVPHSQRVRTVMRIYWAGVRQGQEDTLEMYVNDRETFERIAQA